MRPHVEHVAAFLRGFLSDHGLSDENANRFADHIIDFRRIAITPEQAVTINAALGNDTQSLEAYRDSGENDWTRNLAHLKVSPKTEVEALDPVSLRGLISKALDDALDLDQLQAVKDEEEKARELLPTLVERLNGKAS